MVVWVSTGDGWVVVVVWVGGGGVWVPVVVMGGGVVGCGGFLARMLGAGCYKLW